MCWLS